MELSSTRNQPNSEVTIDKNMIGFLERAWSDNLLSVLRV